ncbi:peptidylprolyl isomerase, partial [Staphylococcus haemolyticus]
MPAATNSKINRFSCRRNYMKTAIVRHILVKEKTLAEQLKKKLQSGADFNKLAQQYST